MILFLVIPIALIIPISLVCSSRLAVIEELKEKKQRNIVIAIIMLKMMFKIEPTWSKVTFKSF